MSHTRKVVLGTELANEALRLLIDKAMGLPAKGTNVGRGPHVVMPETWDGTGPTPLGWTRTAVDLHLGATDSALELPDNFATLIQGPPAQARLTGPERAALATAIAGRVTIDVVASGYTVKLSAAVAAKLEEAK